MNSAEPLRQNSVFFSKLRRRLSSMMERQDKEKHPQTLKDVLKSLAESSSLHGIPKMVSSPQIAVKALWCLLFLATFVVLAFQVYHLFSTYYSNPVDTSVSLKFSPHRFPAITLCNMNPVMDSKMTPELRAIWSQKKQQSSRKRRNVKEYNDYIEVVHEAKLSDTDVPETSIVTSPDINSSDGDFTGQYITPTTVDRSSTPVNTWQQQPIEASRLDNYANRLKLYENMFLHRIPRAASTSSSSSSSSSDSSLESSIIISSSSIDFSLESSSRVSSSDSSFESSSAIISSSLDPSFESLSASSSPSDIYYYYHYNYYDTVYENGSEDSSSTAYGSSYSSYMLENIRSILSGQRDTWEWLRRRFQNRFKSMPVADRMEIGHNIEDMVLKLSFLGYNRNISMFKRIATPEYGNCYTLDDELFQAWRSGPSNGITLTMNLQKDEYMRGFASGYGVRLVFHDTGTFPLPADEGITLSPGTDTNIALKLVELSRLGKPYGDCTDGKAFHDDFNYKYSSSTCLQMCRTALVKYTCECVPLDDPEVGPELHGDEKVCDMTDDIVERCVLSADGSDVKDCDCPVPCREHVYEKTMSWRQWPNSDYLKNVLMAELCRRNTTILDICQEDGELNVSEWQKNFLRLQIYYEDLNYEFITEKPSYEFVRFISDVGGTMGLFIGASLLSLMEFLQLTLEICLWGHQRWKDRKSARDIVKVLPAKNTAA